MTITYLTCKASLSIVITRQLSVEKAMAKRAADTREKIEAKHKVTALQKAIFEFLKRPGLWITEFPLAAAAGGIRTEDSVDSATHSKQSTCGALGGSGGAE